jgi:hypothetical protein
MIRFPISSPIPGATVCDGPVSAPPAPLLVENLQSFLGINTAAASLSKASAARKPGHVPAPLDLKGLVFPDFVRLQRATFLKR